MDMDQGRVQSAVARLVLSAGVLVLAGWCGGAGAAETKKPHYPIIDVHAHALYLDYFDTIGYPNDRWTGKPTPRYTDETLARAALASMDRYNVVKAVLSGKVREQDIWKAIAPDRFILGMLVGGDYTVPVEEVRRQIESGHVQAIGEVFTQYFGLPFDSPEVEPYYQLAEQYGLTVDVHAGISEPSEVKASGLTKFRVALGNPLVGMEESMIKHPDVRFDLGHAAYPFAEATIGLMQMYPQLYVDTAAIGYAVPRKGFHDYLKRLIEGADGIDKRIMFASDFYLWPESQIRLSVEAIDSAKFLTEEQKKDIFCRNAQRFLKLDPSVCEPQKAAVHPKRSAAKAKA